MREKRFFEEHELTSKKRNALLEKLKEKLSAKDFVVFAYLHGSFAEGGRFRDIDIAVYTESPEGEIQDESELAAALSEKIHYPVEIKIINKAPVSFQMAVLRNGLVLITRDEKRRTDFIEDVSRRYGEYSHFRNIVLATKTP